jgi:hypothetical protein
MCVQLGGLVMWLSTARAGLRQALEWTLIGASTRFEVESHYNMLGL